MRIIQISDLHFGMNNALIIEAFLTDLVELEPEIIIISGDLTQRATHDQYELAKEFLQKLSPSKVLVVPGNHDIPLYSPLSRLLHPFKLYKQFITPKLGCNFSNKEINILGVNSATPYKIKDGVLNNHTLSLIKNHFSGADRTFNLLFFHHNINYFSGMHHPLANSEELINYLIESPIHMVCTGHLHYANLKLITKKNNQQCAILHAGSLCCERKNDKMNSYYVIDTDKLNCHVDWRVFSNNTFSSHQSYQLNF